MKEFQGEDYLLHSQLAVDLYMKYAAKVPVFDFHCHLSPKAIYEDKPFSNIASAWLGEDGQGDHYKWRLMRQMGMSEWEITGDVPDEYRFEDFASAMPYFLGNPVYEWCHLELKRNFGINDILNGDTASDIYQRCNAMLKELTPRELIRRNNVRVIFTTDDPADDLFFHEEMFMDTEKGFEVIPCFRPDRYLRIRSPEFPRAVFDLACARGMRIQSFKDLVDALFGRLSYFREHGCLASDHALDTLPVCDIDEEKASRAFDKAYSGESLTDEEADCYVSTLLWLLGRRYYEMGIAQQYHIGALRNNSEKGYELLGPDTGFDAVGDEPIARKLSALLSRLQKDEALPQTILYAANEKDYGSLVTLCNAFQERTRGKIQVGAAWWFNDHYDGIRKQIRAVMNGGLISCFVGMLTDSRSFLSFPRHEYFRRILVDEIALLVEEGRYPYDEKMLGEIIRRICFDNAREFFGYEGW